MTSLTKKLASAAESGVYELTSRPEDVETAAKEAGLAVFRLNLRRATDKKGFLQGTAKALHFPKDFGANWDALNDYLCDLDWLSTTTGYVLVFENTDRFAVSHPQDFTIGVEVLRAASEYWKARNRPFWAFIIASTSVNSGLPTWHT